jgi:hypothetical protein
VRGGYIPHDDHRAEFALTTALVRVDARPDFPSSERFRHRVEKKNAPSVAFFVTRMKGRLFPRNARTPRASSSRTEDAALAFGIAQPPYLDPTRGPCAANCSLGR